MNVFVKRAFSSYCFRFISTFPSVENANLDWEYFLNPCNHNEILENAKRRGIKKDVTSIIQQLCHSSKSNPLSINIISENPELKEQLIWLPNKTHPRVLENLTENPVLLEKIGTKPHFSYFPANFDSISLRLNLIRTRYLGHITGSRSYYLKNDLSLLERALVKFTLQRLLQKGFILVSVPDIVSKTVFKCCGMKTEGEHSQVFHIGDEWGKDLCLSGTAEMSLAAYMAQKTLHLEELPLRLCSVSRCYRAEAKTRQTEKGIFRVHAFTKVEMFGVTADENNQESEKLMEEFIEIEKTLFQELGLHFKVLEMPPCDLGLPAYHKVDIEAWMPGRNIYGEISSASNCTDYQSRRLNIKYNSPATLNEKYCHTVNGTACAVPRMLIAIFENFQNLNGSINVPNALQPYLNKKIIGEKFPEVLRCMKPSG